MLKIMEAISSDVADVVGSGSAKWTNHGAAWMSGKADRTFLALHTFGVAYRSSDLQRPPRLGHYIPPEHREEEKERGKDHVRLPQNSVARLSEGS